MATAREESGEGSVFGHKVSAYLMSRLGSRSSYSNFCGAPIIELTLQGSYLGVPFDDQVVTVQERMKKRRHLLQCKIQVVVQPSNKKFQDVLSRVYAAIVSNEGILSDDYFVIVCQECAKADDLEKLFRFASGSRSLEELQQKLDSENQSLLTLLQAIIDALNNSKETGRLAGISILEDKVIHTLVKRMRIWKCDLNNEGSDDRRSAEHGLLAFCSSSIVTARELYACYASVAAGSEARRATFTWESLQAEYGCLTEPNQITEFERDLSAEAVLRFEGEVDAAILDLATQTFEISLVLRDIIESNKSRLTQAMSSEGSEANKFVEAAGRAIRAYGLSLLKLNARHSVLRNWLEQHQYLAHRCGALWFPIAKIAFEIGDEKLFLEVTPKIEEEDESHLIKARAMLYKGDMVKAKAILESVQGKSRPDALLLTASIGADLDPTESGHLQALGYLDEAIALKPDSIILRLMRANHLFAQFLPFVSSAYLPGFDKSVDVAEGISEALKVLDDAAQNSALGTYERLIVARIRFDLYGLLPTIPALIPVSREELLNLVALQGPYWRRHAAAITANCGDIETATEILQGITSEDDPDDNQDETFRLLRCVRGESSFETFIPRLDNQTITGLSILRQGFFGSIDIDPGLASQMLSAAVTSPIDCSFIPELKIASYLNAGDIEQATASLEVLFERFPFAVGTWSNLLHWLCLRADRLRHEIGTADKPNGSLALSLRVARHLCNHLPFNRHFASWIQLAGCDNFSDTYELDQIGEVSASKGNNWASALAKALACEDRKDHVNAAAYFDYAMDNGGLSRDLRLLRDQCRWFARRFDDLAAEKDDLLADKGRHPGQVQATISALRELDRGLIAWQVAQLNQEDFPEDEIAHWIAFQTARELGLEREWGQLLTSYTHKFPQSNRVLKIEVGESGEEIITLMDQHKEGFELWQGHYARCDIPLKLMPGKLSFNYVVQSMFVTGLQTTRTGFGIRLATREELGKVIILDETAILTLSNFGLWEQATAAGLKLLVPDFVENGIRTEARILAIERNKFNESRLDRVNAFLRLPSVRVCHQVTDENDSPILGLTYSEADGFLAEKRGLFVLGDQDDGGHSLGEVLIIAQKSGRMSSAIYLELSEILSSDATLNNLSEFPTKILLNNQMVEDLASLPNAYQVLDLFEEVWVGPSALFGLSIQLGRVESERASRKLMERVVTDLDRHFENGKIQIKSTNNGKLEEVDYFKALCSLAAEMESTVWVDDMATRRLLTSSESSCSSVSTLEMLAHLGQSNLIEKEQAELHVLEVVDGGHRDPFWADLITWQRDLPITDKYRRTYISRLAWQVRECHLNPEEKKMYFDLLKRNLAACLSNSVDDFLSFFDIALRVLDGDANDLIETILTILQFLDRPDAIDIALLLAESAQKSGKFSMRIWSRQRMNEMRRIGAKVLDLSQFSESAEFCYWITLSSRLYRDAKKRLENTHQKG